MNVSTSIIETRIKVCLGHMILCFCTTPDAMTIQSLDANTPSSTIDNKFVVPSGVELDRQKHIAVNVDAARR